MKKIIFYATEFNNDNKPTYKDYSARLYSAEGLDFAITHTNSGYRAYEITTGLLLTTGYFATLAEVKIFIDKNGERLKPCVLNYSSGCLTKLIMQERISNGYNQYAVINQEEENNKRMRIIKYRQGSNDAYLGYVNCEYIGTTSNGVEIYFEKIDDDETSTNYFFYCKINGVNIPLVDVIRRMTAGECGSVDEMYNYVFKLIEELPPERVLTFTTADGRLKDIQLRVSENRFTNNADILFCELCGNKELAEQARINRTIYMQKQKEQEEKKQAEFEELERIEKEKKAQQRTAELEQAEINLRNGKYIKPADFEELCIKYGVKISIKTLGWLREWCTDISFEKYYIWSSKDKRKHTSSTIFTYMQQLKAAMCA